MDEKISKNVLIYLLKRVDLLIYLRIGAFLSLLFVILRHTLECEFTDEFLEAFPMFFSLYPDALAEKRLGSIFFPLVVNIILWCPIRKVYGSMYGILYVEKWKTFFQIIYFGILCIFGSFFDQIGTAKYYCAFFIAAIYFLSLKYSFKNFQSKEFLQRHQIEEKKTPKDYGVYSCIAMIYFGAFLSFSIDESGFSERVIFPEMKMMFVDDIAERVEDISLDNQIFLLVKKKVEDGKNGEVQILDLKKGENFEIETDSGVDFFKFLKGDKYAVLSDFPENQNNKDENLNRRVRVFDVETGEELRGVAIGDLLKEERQEMGFSKDGKFFSPPTYYRGIWEYKTRKCVATYFNENSEKSFIWLNGNTYMFIQQYDKDNKIEVSLNQILKNNTIEKKEKNKISSYSEREVSGLTRSRVFLREVDDKRSCIITEGYPINGLLDYKSNITVWDVENERILYSVESGYRVLDVIFSEDKERFLIVERMKNKDVRISYWYLGEKEKEVYLRGVRGRNFEIKKFGKEFIDLKQPVLIWNIK